MSQMTTEFFDEQNVLALIGTEWFVRTDGNDANTGRSNTAGGAFLTIGHALTVAQPGDTVSVNDGTYLTPPLLLNTSNLNYVTLASVNGSAAVTIKIDNDAHYVNNAGSLFQVSGVIGFNFVGLTISGSTGSQPSGCVSLVLVNGNGLVGLFNCHVTLAQYDFELLHPPPALTTPAAIAGICVRAGNSNPLAGFPAGTPGRAHLHNCLCDYFQYCACYADSAGSRLTADNCTSKGILSLIGPTPWIIQRGFYVADGGSLSVSNSASIDLGYNGPSVGQPAGWASGYVCANGGGFFEVLNCTAATCDAGTRITAAAAGSRVDQLTVTSPTHNGIWLLSGATGVNVTRSKVTSAAAVGIQADAGSSANAIVGNKATGSVTFDGQDQTTGAGTAGTANYWNGNMLGTKNPAGLQ
jgi:hypothetical protein